MAENDWRRPRRRADLASAAAETTDASVPVRRPRGRGFLTRSGQFLTETQIEELFAEAEKAKERPPGRPMVREAKVGTSVRLPPELRKAVERYCRRRGMSFSEVARAALVAYIDDDDDDE